MSRTGWDVRHSGACKSIRQGPALQFSDRKRDANFESRRILKPGNSMAKDFGTPKPSWLPPKKWAAPARASNVPIHHINASYVRSHFDRWKSVSPDAPKANELLLAAGDDHWPRVHARVGGLKASEIKGAGRFAMKSKIRKIVRSSKKRARKWASR